MKKIISLSTIVFMILSLIFIPIKSSAGVNTELENVINRAKYLFDIGDKYDNFNYSIHSDANGYNVYSLEWSMTNMSDILSVSIDSSGNVLSYSISNKNSSLRKIPVIQKTDAKKRAVNFIAKVSPYYAQKVTYYDKNDRFATGLPSYDIYFVRKVNDVIYPSNYIDVMVDGLTGKILNYNVVWSNNVTFADAKNIISSDEALNLFKNKLGIKLIYKINQVDKKPYLTYSYPFYNEGIDAVTGDVTYFSNMVEPLYDKAYSATGGMPNSNITPEEQAAIEKSAKLIKFDDALKKAREFFNIDDSFTVLESSLTKSWINKDQYFWNIELYNKSGNYPSYSIEINALTGEICSFSHYENNYDKNVTNNYTRDQALNIASNYIKEHYADKYGQIENVNWNNFLSPYIESYQPGYYSFTFKRVVNGAYFQNDGFNVTVNAVTGKVASLDKEWYEGDIPAKDNIISIDEAYDIFMKNNSFMLTYQPEYTTNNYYYSNNDKMNAKLVYSIITGGLFDIDAYTGKLIGISGAPYGDNTKTYSDIKGIKQEKAITELCKYGIYLPGDKFNPNNSITQKDFLYLLEKSLSLPIYFDFVQYDNDDSIYDNLTQLGVVKTGEKSANSYVTKQDAVKFIIRALHLNNAADLNIYKLTYADSKSIDPALRGYVAIAGALNIINSHDKYFYPKQNLTRADAAVLIYNYLIVN